MEQLPSNIQVLLQAAEYLERREREAEHGYASILPYETTAPGRRKRQRTYSNPDSVRSVHNELEKHRRAQLRRCLEQLKQQVPASLDASRHTTLSLLHRARQHIKVSLGSWAVAKRPAPRRGPIFFTHGNIKTCQL
ncbi:hypothetical protein FKM82_012374 [Ascaphus truei]